MRRTLRRKGSTGFSAKKNKDPSNKKKWNLEEISAKYGPSVSQVGERIRLYKQFLKASPETQKALPDVPASAVEHVMHKIPAEHVGRALETVAKGKMNVEETVQFVAIVEPTLRVHEKAKALKRDAPVFRPVHIEANQPPKNWMKIKEFRVEGQVEKIGPGDEVGIKKRNGESVELFAEIRSNLTRKKLEVNDFVKVDVTQEAALVKKLKVKCGRGI